MSRAGERLIEGAKEALAIAKGEQPAARIHVNGHAYVPEAELDRVRFHPLGDNHHNAVKCPYCNPDRLDPAALLDRISELEAALAEIANDETIHTKDNQVRLCCKFQGIAMAVLAQGGKRDG